ncbi:MAG: DegV family protein [Lachnospiraceae bacterium]|nr:DegV family protein [Lachnospiraceae bacterium]MDE7272455.1 DegV family protein [Lachnospiraceae bacterium]
MDYKIVTDGSCDLPPELCREKEVDVVPFYVSFDSEHYMREIVDMPIRKFYEQMVADPTTFPKSSMPSVQDYVDVFMPIVNAGKAVICICITTKFSGSYQSAMNAKEMVLESCPDARITVMDSTVDTVLQGIFVLEAVRMYEAKLPYEKVVGQLEAIKGTGRIFFTVGNIDYLKHGGRIGKLAGLAGSVLGIKPLITLKEGEIFPSGVSRSRRKSLEKVYELLWQYLQEVNAVSGEYSICVGYGYDIEEAEAFRKGAVDFLNAKGYHITDAELEKYQIGATISVHTGPYPLGFGVLRKSMLS